jgi:hypothetical protein
MQFPLSTIDRISLLELYGKSVNTVTAVGFTDLRIGN